MGAQDRTEKVLREIHVLFSNAQPVKGKTAEVIVDKNEAMDLLRELNECMADMMDEYEITHSAKERAAREDQKLQEARVEEAAKKAEDVYAASIIYTKNALDEIQNIMQKNAENLEQIYTGMKDKLEKELRTVKNNGNALQAQLEAMKDSDKYFNIIEDENEKRRRLRGDSFVIDAEEKNPYADIVPEIRINQQYFEDNDTTV